MVGVMDGWPSSFRSWSIPQLSRICKLLFFYLILWCYCTSTLRIHRLISYILNNDYDDRVLCVEYLWLRRLPSSFSGSLHCDSQSVSYSVVRPLSSSFLRLGCTEKPLFGAWQSPQKSLRMFGIWCLHRIRSFEFLLLRFFESYYINFC